MIEIVDIRYVRLGTTDLAAAVRFATEMVGLELADHDDKRAYLRGDHRDHSICYIQGDPNEHVLGFELAGLRELDAAA